MKKRIVLPKTVTITEIIQLHDQLFSVERATFVEIDFGQMQSFDSSLIALITKLRKQNVRLVFENVSAEYLQAEKLFPSSDQVISRKSGKFSIIQKADDVKVSIQKLKNQLKRFFSLLADEIYYTVQYLLKPQGIYRGEITNQLYFMAYRTFPIVSLIAFLIGITISITSVEQLRLYGADVYLADLVGFSMIRELVPLMTGIILSGKVGAAIAAEISSMNVMEEISALKTMGIIPEKFLMVPRLIAISLAVPLLVVIADCVGILGGILVSKLFSNIPLIVFMNQMLSVVDALDLLIGLGKTLVFGWIVVVCSGYKGFGEQRGAQSVGIATTESVVLSISLIIITDCIFAFLLY